MTTPPGGLVFSLTSRLTSVEVANLTLHVCAESLRFASAGLNPGVHSYSWPSAGLDWSSLTTRTLSLSVPIGTSAPTASDSKVTTDEDTPHTFAAGDFSFSDTDPGGTLAGVRIVALPHAGQLELSDNAVTRNQLVTRADLDAGHLTFTPAPNGNGDPYTSFTFTVSDGTHESAAWYTMTIEVTAVNDRPQGVPTITGTTHAGQTLTASRAAISDDDGLPANESDYRYAWLLVDGGTAHTTGATSRTYRLTSNDVGKTLKVRVSYTDDDGTPESVTSEETSTVVANPARNRLVGTSEDTPYTFKASDFGLTEDDALMSVIVTSLPGRGALNFDHTALTSTDLPKTVTAMELGEDKLVYDPPETGTGEPFATFQFKVHDGTVESAAANMAVTVVTRTAPTATDREVETTEDRDYTFTESDFGLTEGFTAEGVIVTSLPASGTGGLKFDGIAITRTELPKTMTAAELGEDRLVYDPPETGTGEPFARFLFKVYEGTLASGVALESATATMNIDVVTGTQANVCTAPNLAGRRQIWTGKVTVGTFEISGTTLGHGFGTSALWSAGASLSETMFDVGSNPYTIDSVYVHAAAPTPGALALSLTSRLTRTEVADLTVHVCTNAFALAAARYVSGDQSYIWSSAGLDWALATSRTLYLSVARQNTAPTASESKITATANTDYAFAASEFKFNDVEGDALANVIVTSLPASTKGDLKFDGTMLTNADLPKTVTAAELGEDKLVYDPPASGTGTGFASFEFKVHDGTVESASAAIMIIDLVANTPRISGHDRNAHLRREHRRHRDLCRSRSRRRVHGNGRQRRHTDLHAGGG